MNIDIEIYREGLIMDYPDNSQDETEFKY